MQVECGCKISESKCEKVVLTPLNHKRKVGMDFFHKSVIWPKMSKCDKRVTISNEKSHSLAKIEPTAPMNCSIVIKNTNHNISKMIFFLSY